MGSALYRAAVEGKSETVEAVPPSISVVTSSAAAAPDIDKDPLNREKLWWEIQRTTCSKTDYDFYIKLIKSQLLLLQRTAQRTIESYKEMKSSEDIATYQQHLDNIFSDDHVSATALNVKSLQCAVLFALMLPDQSSGIEPFRDHKTLSKFKINGWDTYDIMFLYIKSDREPYNSAYIYDLIIDETASCVPSFKDKAFIVLLGEMTLYELLSSMANDVYLIGLPTKHAYADGSYPGPLSFLLHDLLHMSTRKHYNKITTETNPLIQFFLKHLNTKGAKVRDTCHMFLFLVIHERSYNEWKLLNVLNKEEDTYSIVNPGRFLNKKDLGGFLPKDREFTEEEVISWLQSEWSIFSKEWNEQIISYKEEILAAAAASNWGSNMGGENFREATERNAGSYNLGRPSGGNSAASSGGSRRRSGSRSRSKTQTRQRQQTRKHSLNLFKRNKE